ncbi:MAG: hypothetical protein ACLTYW_10135 [Collinsella sp.]
MLPCSMSWCLPMRPAAGERRCPRAADMTSPNPQDRVVEARFTLKAGVSFGSGSSHLLVCRDAQSGKIVWRETYTIAVSFAPVADFGF